MRKKGILFVFLSVCMLLTSCVQKDKEDVVELQNPIIPGYFADPSIVQYEGKFYMYVTADPWGADFLSCWVSDDFENWTFNKLNWPTKAACTSPLSNHNMVWAPSVIEKDGAFYMYISVGSEIWCGRAEHPLGPWENMLGDQPMLAYDTTRYVHVIDAEAFIDDDGKAYLYWGSGWEWKNGRCFAAQLNDDMSSFVSEPVEITPTRYFEGPLMIKHNAKYYLTYSEGKTIDETYEVRYAIGDNPLGPFTEASNSPILTANDSLKVYGPGHHTVFQLQGKNYILYHRHRMPFERGTAFRQTCIAELTFDDSKNQINNIIPYHTQKFPRLAKSEINYIQPLSVVASSERDEYRLAKNAIDKSYSTLWEAKADDEAPYLLNAFADAGQIEKMEVRFEYPWETYYPKIEVSQDENSWQTIADYTVEGISGSPVTVPVGQKAKYIKISFELKGNAIPAIFEVCYY